MRVVVLIPMTTEDRVLAKIPDSQGLGGSLGVEARNRFAKEPLGPN